MRWMDMKLYGFALTPNQNNCFGVAIDEIGNYRGHHTSSNYSFLKSDLASKAPECEFEFIENDIPYKNIIYSLVNEINFIGNDKAKNDADYLKLSADNNKLTQLFSVQLDIIKQNETLTKQLEVAREALEFYADIDSWDCPTGLYDVTAIVDDESNHYYSDVAGDFDDVGGKRARQALKDVE